MLLSGKPSGMTKRFAITSGPKADDAAKTLKSIVFVIPAKTGMTTFYRTIKAI